MSGPQEADLRQSQLGLLRGEEHRGLHRARGDGAHVRRQVTNHTSVIQPYAYNVCVST